MHLLKKKKVSQEPNWSSAKEQEGALPSCHSSDEGREATGKGRKLMGTERLEAQLRERVRSSEALRSRGGREHRRGPREPSGTRGGGGGCRWSSLQGS